METEKHETEVFFNDVDSLSMGPLWKVLRNILTEHPMPLEIPYQWKWEDVRELVYKSTKIVSAAEAERRVLMLLNPKLKNQNAITQTLYAGIQIIMPGEIARTHRHTPNALRFIMEGDGAYTSVNGEKIPMKVGDLVLTPTWSWHDHGNEGNNPVVWLDGLDIPLVTSLSGIFFEEYPSQYQSSDLPVGYSSKTYGKSLFPSGGNPKSHYSPIMKYPYTEARAAIENVQVTEYSEHEGLTIEYVNPMNGGSILPTIDAHLHLIKNGEILKPLRHSSSKIFLGVEGGGTLEIDGREFKWKKNDVIAVPSWAKYRHINKGKTDSVLFSFSNAPVLKPFGLFRQELL